MVDPFEKPIVTANDIAAIKSLVLKVHKLIIAGLVIVAIVEAIVLALNSLYLSKLRTTYETDVRRYQEALRSYNNLLPLPLEAPIPPTRG